MNRKPGLRIFVAAALCAVTPLFPTTRLAGQVVSLDPAKMARIGTVDERFQSYNVEMLEITGGGFWKPLLLMRGTPNAPPRFNHIRSEGRKTW